MKTYFDFKLKGGKLILPYLVYLVCFAVYPIMLYVSGFASATDQTAILNALGPLSLGYFSLIIGAFFFYYFIYKLVISGIVIGDESVVCQTSPGGYLKTILLGAFLTLITFGIYAPWFIRKMIALFVDKSTYKGEYFRFKGVGSSLFVIYLVSMLLLFPFMVCFFGGAVLLTMPDYFTIGIVLYVLGSLFMFLWVCGLIYVIYNWMFDIQYKDYTIRWNTNFWPATMKVLLEVGLSCITLGIYWPYAWVRLYAYFAEKTVVADYKMLKGTIGFDRDNCSDFLFIWGQTLLTLITLGIYYPWALCKVTQRLLSRTYFEEKNELLGSASEEVKDLE